MKNERGGEGDEIKKRRAMGEKTPLVDEVGGTRPMSTFK